MKFSRIFITAVFLLCFFAPESLALTVNTEKVDYIIGDSINVDGTTGSGSGNVTISVYNSTDNLMSSSIVNTTDGTTNGYNANKGRTLNSAYPSQQNLSFSPLLISHHLVQY